MYSVIALSLQPLFDALMSMAGIFIPLAKIIFALFLTIAAVLAAWDWWTSGSLEDVLKTGVRMIITSTVVLSLFANWPGLMKTFAGFFHKEIPTYIAGTGSNPIEVVAKTIEKIKDAAKGSAAVKVDRICTQTPEMQQEECSDVYSKPGGPISWIISGIVTLLNLLLAAAVLFTALMPVAAFHLGAIFGPLILATLPYERMADMTGRWTSFMISNGMTFVVAIVMVNVIALSVTELVKIQEGMTNESTVGGFIGFPVTFFALFVTYIFAIGLLLKADNIAQGITGGVSIGEGLFGKILSGAAAMGMGKMAKAMSVGMPGKTITGGLQAGSKAAAAKGKPNLAAALGKADQIARTPVMGAGSRPLTSPTPYQAPKSAPTVSGTTAPPTETKPSAMQQMRDKLVARQAETRLRRSGGGK
jgi:hypothetical protein